MPALLTHHLFGEEASTLIPDGIIQNQEELLSFLLGNQGPDPFFLRFTTLPETASACHRLAHRMHEEKVMEAFLALRDAVARLPRADEGIGRSFVLGLLAHYVLDSSSHPFIYAEERALCEAGVGLEQHASEVHAIIESDLDSWMLWTMRHQTVRDVPPASTLIHTDRIDRVAGALFSQVALQTFDIAINSEQFAGAVRDYRTFYRAIEPVGTRKSSAVAAIEHIFSTHSMADCMAHHVVTTDECASANLDRRPWRDPWTGEESEDSFPDVFFAALDRWEVVCELFVRGGMPALREQIGRRNYDGAPVTGDEG